MYFESHAHYDDSRFDGDRTRLLNSLFNEKGIDYIINIGADMKSSKESIALSDMYENIYAAIGVHPHDVEDMTEKDIEDLRELSKHKKVVAIGEIGLDYYYDNSPRDLQRKWFFRQLELAKDLKLPVVIHSREAAKETFDIIKESGVRNGVIHCFSGSAEMAEEYIKLGFFIGIGGSLTFKNNKKTVEVVEKIPMEHILLETDSPYLAPVPNRGKRNDSGNLVFIAEKISEIKGITPANVAKITKDNAIRLFFK